MNEITQAPKNIVTVFGSKSWAKRENEPPEAWFAFCSFLQSKEPSANKWITNLTDDDKECLPKSYKNAAKLRTISKKFAWELRKNDYFNEIVLSAQRKYEDKMDKTGGNIASIVHKLGLLAERSLNKKLEEFQNGNVDMSIQEILALTKMHVDYRTELLKLETHQQNRANLKKTPVQNIRKLLAAVNKLKD